jgi:short-subunit dehydrogenase
MKNKVVVITGGSSGIGKALAEVFAKAGANIVIAARHADKMGEVEAELRKYAEVMGIVTDVSREDDCKRLIEETLNRFGGIDVLINNAGISMRALIEEVDLGVLHQLMDTNFWGTVYCTRYALPYLLKRKGSVVGISSIAGKKGLPGRAGYSASKFAMEGFLEVLRIENLKKELHVLVANPGFTATNIRKSSLSKTGIAQGDSPRNEKEMMLPEFVAQKIYQAVVYRKRDLVLTTNGKLTVFLNALFPALMDRVVYNHLAKEPGSTFGK